MRRTLVAAAKSASCRGTPNLRRKHLGKAVVSDSKIVPGEILVQKYRIESVLGEGGMGVVFAARHLALGERVAIKVLSCSASENPEALARFQREARILARVHNEHVVRVFDLGKLGDGAPFIVMEYLAGRDLATWIHEQGRLLPEQAVGFVLQALVALAGAHTSGVVHRDLKPENIFCVEREDGALLIKVLDFGVSRLERASEDELFQSSVTRTSTVVGTPLYMSPEQLRNAKGVDARGDIWSLGVVLYELLTGVAPFTGASYGDVAIKIATEQPQPFSAFDPAIAPGLEAVVLRCLEKDRENRFANVADLARGLLPFGPANSEQIVERIERMLLRPLTEPDELERPWFPEPEEGAQPDAVTLGQLSSEAVAPVSPSSSSNRRLLGAPRARLLVGVSGLLALLVAWLLLRPSSAASPPTIETKVSRELHAAAPPTVRSLPDEPLSEQAPPIASGESSSTREPLRSSSSIANKMSRKVPSPIGTASRTGQCDPPYTVDAQGRKRFRHECFIQRRVQ